MYFTVSYRVWLETCSGWPEYEFCGHQDGGKISSLCPYAAQHVISFTDHWSIIALPILIREGFLHFNRSLILKAHPGTCEKESKKHFQALRPKLSLFIFNYSSTFTCCIIFNSIHYMWKETWITVNPNIYIIFILNSSEV